MEDLISLLFLARDLAHREHLKTRSYAQHKALRSFYNDIVDNADAIAEIYQGIYALMDYVPIEGYTGKTGIVPLLEKHVKWIKDNRYKVCDRDDTAIQNLIDAAVETYASALYKLRFLS